MRKKFAAFVFLFRVFYWTYPSMFCVRNQSKFHVLTDSGLQLDVTCGVTVFVVDPIL